MLEEWLWAHWWLGVLILPFLFFRQILDALTAPGEARKLLREWKERKQDIALQYSRVQAIIAPPNKDGVMGAAPRVFLDNPNPFPLKIRFDTMVTTFNFMVERDLSAQKQEEIIGAGARNFVVEFPDTGFKLRAKQDSFPIRLIWEMRYGRADVEEPALDNFIRISGDLRIRLFSGRFESQWKEDSYSASPVQDIPDIVAEDAEGGLHRR